MQPQDWIPIVISVVALIGSGYNLYLYLKQEKRDQERFKLELESHKRELESSTKQIRLFVDFTGAPAPSDEGANLVILNIGQRPVTITDVLVDIYRNNDPTNVYGRSVMILPEPVREEHLPRKLDEGESIEIPLGINRLYLASQMAGLRVDVFDVEGDKFNEFAFREHDKFHGFYRTIEDV